MNEPAPTNRSERSLESRRRRLIDALREVARHLGPDVSLARFYRETGISTQQVYRLFNNWGEARTAAGLPAEVDRSRVARRYSREQLLAWLTDLVEERGENIRLSDYLSRTGVSYSTIGRLFGGWQDLKRAAGLTPFCNPAPRRNFTREAILERLQALVQERGDITLFAFCCELHTSPAMLARFGSWAELRRALNLPLRARTRRTPRDPQDWQSQLVAQIPPEPPPPPGLPPDPLANLTLTQLLHIAKSRARQQQAEE